LAAAALLRFETASRGTATPRDSVAIFGHPATSDDAAQKSGAAREVQMAGSGRDTPVACVTVRAEAARSRASCTPG